MPAEKKEQTRQIIQLIIDGEYPKSIAKKVGMSQSALSHKLKRMEKNGYVKSIRSRPKFYGVMPAGKNILTFEEKTTRNVKSGRKQKTRTEVKNTSSLPVRHPFLLPSVNFHDFKVKIPITQRGRPIKGGKKTELKNWIKDTFHITLPVRLTMDITTRSAILHYHSKELPRNARFFSELLKWYMVGIDGACAFLASNGWRAERLRAEVISQHIAQNPAKEIDNAVPDGSVVSLNLGRKALAITGLMKKNGRAWLDKSNSWTDIETDDLLYEQMLLDMPTTIHKMKRGMVQQIEQLERHNIVDKNYAHNIALYTKQIRKHLKVLGKMEKNQDKMNVMLDLLIKKLSG